MPTSVYNCIIHTLTYKWIISLSRTVYLEYSIQTLVKDCSDHDQQYYFRAQRAMRAQRRAYQQTHAAIVLIQSGWRGLTARRLYAEKVDNIVIVQSQVFWIVKIV